MNVSLHDLIIPPSAKRIASTGYSAKSRKSITVWCSGCLSGHLHSTRYVLLLSAPIANRTVLVTDNKLIIALLVLIALVLANAMVVLARMLWLACMLPIAAIL